MLGFYLSAIDTEEDKSEFEKLYIKYRQDMYAIAYSILHNPQDSEDAVHQAFINIANHFEKIKKIPCQEIKAYIVVIIRNVSITIYNRNKKHREREISLSISEVPIDVNFFEGVEYDELVKAISSLPQINKDVIFLYYLEEFSAKEISDMLGISVENVWKRLERSRKMLKDILDGGNCGK